MELNIANSIFKGINDKKGLMICGYEWGFSKADQISTEKSEYNEDAITIFSNKVPMYGEKSSQWKYDTRIINWFKLWGHPLSQIELGTDFEKSIVQTNWCNTKANKIEENYYHKLTNSTQLENFIFHIKELEPSLIFLWVLQ